MGKNSVLNIAQKCFSVRTLVQKYSNNAPETLRRAAPMGISDTVFIRVTLSNHISLGKMWYFLHLRSNRSLMPFVLIKHIFSLSLCPAKSLPK